MSARSQLTRCAQLGGVEDAVTVSHFGSPERLSSVSRLAQKAFYYNHDEEDGSMAFTLLM
jgi:hypothetical protein